MIPKKRVLLTGVTSVLFVLAAVLVVQAKLPTAFAHTRGLYILFDLPDLNYNPPAYPAVGGVWRYDWSDLEPTNAGYNWTALDAWTLRERDRGKLAAIGFSVFNEFRSNNCGSRGIKVPAWLTGIDSNVRWTSRADGSIAGVCPGWGPWYVPNYWNTTFRNYYQRFVTAFAQHLVDNPEVRDRIAFVSMGIGLSGETQPSSRWVTDEAPDWYYYHDSRGITQEQWVEYVNWCTNMYKTVFAAKGLSMPIFLDIGPTYIGGAPERDAFSSYAAGLGVGLRHNGLLADHKFSVNYAPMIAYWNTVPTGWETYWAYLPSKADLLWAIYCGLAKHPDNFAFDKLLWQTDEYRNLFQFTNAYVGVTTANTPGAWVALRETQQQNGEHGNYNLWMTQKDSAPNGATVADWNVGSTRGYHLDVPNGTYAVDLYFAEVYYNTPGARVFDIKIENNVVTANFDPYVAAGGKNKPVVRSYSVPVSDGRIDIDFVQKADNEPTIHAIQITGPGYTQRVNCGGGSYTDTMARVWVADQEYESGSFGYVGGSTYQSTSDIIGTNDDTLYQTMRVVWTGAPAVGRFCRRTDQASGNDRMRFDIDNNYLYNGSFSTVTISVTYYSTGTDRWELRYDAIGNLDKAATPAGSANPWVQKDNSGLWKKAVFYLTDARFANGQPGGTDFSIHCSDDGNEWISFVEVTKGGSQEPTATPTVTPVLATLAGKVSLQGRPAPPNAQWVVALTVKVGATSYTATTDASGNFVVPGIAPGTYDICVKNSHTLSNKRTGVVLASGTNNVDFGTLREGDGNNDDYVTIVDFSLLSAGFFPSYNAAADFNQDGYVNINDFSLLSLNFGGHGDCAP